MLPLILRHELCFLPPPVCLAAPPICFSEILLCLYCELRCSPGFSPGSFSLHQHTFPGVSYITVDSIVMLMISNPVSSDFWIQLPSAALTAHEALETNTSGAEWVPCSPTYRPSRFHIFHCLSERHHCEKCDHLVVKPKIRSTVSTSASLKCQHMVNHTFQQSLPPG